MVIDRISRDEMLMSMARIASLRGTCSRAKVGVVISREGRVLVTGYNGAPAGINHCIHVGSDPCSNAVHAENNAIAFAARHGIALADSEMHVTMSPCRSCAQSIINAGITRIVIDSFYRDPAGIELLNQVGIQIIHFEDL